jgi:putative inorganic carbon (hco3(-)) transporter
MLVHSDRSHRIQQILERVIVVALFVYVVCSVISISAMQTAYILALVAWAIRLYLQSDTRQLRLPLFMPFGAFLLASVLATILAVEPLESLIELRNVFEALVFYLIVNQVTTEERATTLVRVLIVTTAIMALYGLSQSFTYGVNFRVRGTMDSKMTFAGLLMLVELMAVVQVLFQTHRRQLVWTIPALLLITAALLMTQTRSAWCGLIAGCCVILGLRKKVLLLAVPLGALVVLLLVPQTIKMRALSIADRQDITAQERLSMWSSGVRIIRDYPWTGVGMGAMVRTYAHYREPDSPVDPKRRIGHLHNNIIQIATERGLLGLACWLWIWGAYGYHTWRIYERLGPEHRPAKALVVGSLASVIGFHIEGLFEHTFGDSEVITLTYFLMALPFVVQYGLPQPSDKGRVACLCPLSSEEHHGREHQGRP